MHLKVTGKKNDPSKYKRISKSQAHKAMGSTVKLRLRENQQVCNDKVGTTQNSYLHRTHSHVIGEKKSESWVVQKQHGFSINAQV